MSAAATASLSLTISAAPGHAPPPRARVAVEAVFPGEARQ
jgi:hypothetical protein